MSKEKKIGIVGWKTGENSFGVTSPYLHYLSQFGEVEILMPQKGVVGGLDLLVLPGGLDLNPLNYGEVPGFYTSNQDVFKQYFFDVNLKQYISKNVPVFGICLGFQQLCALFGSKLTQDMVDAHPYSDPRYKLVHDVYKVEVVGEALSYKKTTGKDKKEKYDKFSVNSLHHQGVMINDLSRDLTPLLIAHDYECVEGMKHNTLPIAGVQYHPEETWCEYASDLILKLLNNGKD